MPPGALIVYTPRNPEELSVCYSLFFAAYHSACKLPSGSEMIAKFATVYKYLLRDIAAPS